VSRGVWTLTGVLLLAGTLGPLAACGNAQFTYVKNSGEQTYFKVPAGWHKIDENSLNRLLMGAEDPDSATAQQLQNQITWTVAYDAATDPTANHLNGGEQPFVLASVRKLTEDEQGEISINILKNYPSPVTQEARDALKQQGQEVRNFEWLRDEVLKPSGGGLRGVRETYNFSPHPLLPLQTFDKTAYLSDDGHLYWMLIRCSARCFRDRASELDSIAKSFTVRKQ
jgi:hypothetical protein